METGLAMAAIKLVGNLARPVIMEFVKNRFFILANRRVAQNNTPSVARALCAREAAECFPT